VTARSTGSRSWPHLAALLDDLLKARDGDGLEAIPPAVSVTTRRHARALAASLRADLEREYPTQREAAEAWGVDISTARRQGLRVAR